MVPDCGVCLLQGSDELRCTQRKLLHRAHHAGRRGEEEDARERASALVRQVSDLQVHRDRRFDTLVSRSGVKPESSEVCLDQ